MTHFWDSPVCGFEDSPSELIPNGCLSHKCPAELRRSYLSAFLIFPSVCHYLRFNLSRAKVYPLPSLLQYTSLVHQGWWKQHLTTWPGRKWESPLPPLLCSCDYSGAAGSVSGSALFSPVFCYQPGTNLHRCSSRLLKNLSTVPQTWILPLWQSISHVAINTNQIMAAPSLDLPMASLCLTINENIFTIVCKTPLPACLRFFLSILLPSWHSSSLCRKHMPINPVCFLCTLSLPCLHLHPCMSLDSQVRCQLFGAIFSECFMWKISPHPTSHLITRFYLLCSSCHYLSLFACSFTCLSSLSIH